MVEIEGINSPAGTCFHAEVAGDVSEVVGGISIIHELTSRCHSDLLNDSSIFVPLIRQQYSWDCGLACVAMVLSALEAAPPLLTRLYEICGTNSVWTIDLAHLLRRYGALVSLTTIYIGPNPAYKEEKFYAKHLQDDMARVTALFGLSESSGIPVHQYSCSGQDLRWAMSSSKYLVVALVDKSKLNECVVAQGAPYTGHFILLHGYDRMKDEYLVKDPASGDSLTRVPADRLEAARTAYGTDEDLLFIKIPPPDFGMESRHASSEYSAQSFAQKNA